MKKLDLWKELGINIGYLNAIFNDIADGDKFEKGFNKLTCKDLKRINESLDTLCELFGKCVIKEDGNYDSNQRDGNA